MMKDLGRKIFVGVAAVGLVLILLIYFKVFRSYNEKTEQLEKSNAELKVQVADMKQYYDHIDDYNDESEQLRKEINEIVKEYPADAREEDVLMMAVDMQEISPIQYEVINIQNSEVLYSIPAEEVITAGQEDLTMEIGFVEKKTSYAGIVDYKGMKNCIQEIYSNPNRIGINNISFVREESTLSDEDSDFSVTLSYLKGNIDVSFYSMTGTGKEYKAPEIPNYVEGVTNPFKLAIGLEEKKQN